MKTMRIGKVDFHIGAARKAEPEDYTCSIIGPNITMGYCWWFWLPRYRYNGGKRGQVISHTFQWLRFVFNVTIWDNFTRKNDTGLRAER